MKPILWLLAFWAGIYPAMAQHVAEGRMLDTDTHQPLLFGSVGVVGNQRGTIGNSEGYFRLETFPGDTLVFAFVGYYPTRVAVASFPADGIIYLKSRSVELKTTVITDPDFLYALLARCKNAPPAPTYTAKTYFELNAGIDGQPVEMLEGYYNGRFTGTHIDELRFKNARVFLAEYRKGYFSNLETSKAISMLQIPGSNTFFPDHPFHLSKARLHKMYRLALADKYPDSGTVYVVEFTPRETDGRSFGGRVWIDSTSNHILKLNLQVENARPQPFVAVWPGDSIRRVDLDITYTFKKRGQQFVFDVIHFNYRLVYKGRYEPYTVLAQCILRVYDHETQFPEPFYEYDHTLSDYRKITGLPYNAFFWNHRDSLVATDQQKVNRSFFQNRGSSFNHPDSWKGANKSLFEYGNIQWNDHMRLKMREFDTTVTHGAAVAIPSRLYRLKAQLYMDINTHGDSVNAFTATLFDVFDSYYHLPLDSATDCFLNIYFDLYEIERRLLETEIRQPGITAAGMAAAYKRHAYEVEQLGIRYLNEVSRGQNRDALKKWNHYVYERLGIDNLRQFSLSP